jgi:2-polyprenyl-3-methyl-5-hydroxy-6-metoxy-1,4-benzoquinol methylase
MRKKLFSFFNYHDVPFGLTQFPSLLRIIVWFNQLLTLRNWYVRKELQTLINVQPKNFNFLDAGCGYGDFIVMNAPLHPKARFVGIDAIESNCEILESYAIKSALDNVSTQSKCLTEIESDSTYDIILCNTVLQYIKEDEVVLTKLRKALKEDGALLLYVPINFKRSFSFFRKLEDRNDFNYDSVHKRAHTYSENELVKRIIKNGYSIEKKIFAHGKYGAFGIELFDSSIWLLRISPIYFLPFTVVIHLAILPCMLLLYGIDFLTTHNTGNGLLIVAKKK